VGKLYRVRKSTPPVSHLSDRSSSNEATDIFFLGVGSAYHGIMYLLNNRGKEGKLMNWTGEPRLNTLST
jgi:hypothetical protein